MFPGTKALFPLGPPLSSGARRSSTLSGRSWARAVAATLLLVSRAPVAAEPGEGGPAADPRVVKVRDLLAQDRWRDSLAEARAWAKEAPEDAQALCALGEALYRAGRIGDAGAVLTPLAVRSAPPSRALLTLGLVRKAEGREEEATSLVERAVRADPRDRHIAFWAADAVATNARAAELLEAYLALSQGDDPSRIEAATDSIEFFRALGDRKVWVPVEHPERVEVPLRALGGEGRMRGYVVDAVLGEGKPVRLLLDTGSSGLFLVERVAKRFSLAPLADATTFGGGGGQRHRTRRGILPSFAIGGLRFKDALVSTMTEEIEPTGQYHGVLGIQFLEGYRVTLDLDRGRFLLEPPAAGAAGEPYWQIAGQLLVQAGTTSGAPGLFVLDTGAGRTVLSLGYAGEVSGGSLGGPASVRGFGGTLEGARSVRGIRLGFQGAETPPSGLVAADFSLQSRLAGVEVSGFLGLDLLSGRRVVIDTRARRVQSVPPRSR